MKDRKILVSECNILQINHIMRNRLHSLLGFIDIICYNNELTNNEKERYLNIIKALSSEIYSNVDGYLKISSEYVE